MPRNRVVMVVVVSASVVACQGRGVEDGTPGPRLASEAQASGTEALLQAVSVVSDDVVWVSGHEAAFARTTDGGATWSSGVVADAGALQFRDVAAFDDRTAYLMSAGTGAQSRIYRTDDGGVSWRLLHTASHPEAFFDCMDFWTPDRGLLYGDAVDGAPFLLTTSDGGASWTRVPAEALPSALEGEGGFAASGTCLSTGPGGRAWVATGAAARARVLMTADYGESWRVAEPPVVGGAAAGLTTIHVREDGYGVALGGVIGNDSIRGDHVVITTDGGVSWTRGGPLNMAGPVYGSALVASGDRAFAVAVGPRGMDWSSDGGRSWQAADTLTYWAVGFSPSGRGWAVGPGGRIARLTVER